MPNSSQPDPTLAPGLRSWVESANDPTGEFPIQNLPFCVFHEDGAHESHLGVRIGDRLLSVTEANHAGLLEGLGFEEEAWEGLQAACEIAAADLLSSLTPRDRSALRARLSAILAAGSESRGVLEDGCIFAANGVEFELPVTVSNYTDFYASIHHANTVGSMFRPDNPLLPNYKWVPIGYHGRASTVDIARTPIKRPKGQTKADDAAAPSFGPCSMLDYELEVGCVIGTENNQGDPIPVGEAHKHVLGYCLVNDWSARDMQKWEYQPLGPFLAKNFATTVSPYLVTPDALEPFRCAAFARPEGDPQPLPYLLDEADQRRGAIDIELEVLLSSADMVKRGMAPVSISKSKAFRELYWTFAQLIAHHTSNGCSLRSGDLLASGTVSGQDASTRGCLLELTWDGPGKPRKPIMLPTGEKRVFLADGDTVTFRGRCSREGAVSIGFGECSGTIAL